MTELEAYKTVEWNPDGDLSRLVLPATGDENTNWCALSCQNVLCPNPFRGVSIFTALFPNSVHCLTCGAAYHCKTEVGGPWFALA